MLILFPLANGLSLAAGASKHIATWQAASGKKASLVGFSLAGDSNVQTDKNVAIELTKTTGLGTGTAVTGRSVDADESGTPITTVQENMTVEPTVSYAIRFKDYHPSGGIDHVFDRDQEFKTATAGYCGIRLTNPASNGTVVTKGSILIRE